MGSIFSGPTVKNRATTTALKKASNTASNASSNINSTAKSGASSITGTGTQYANQLVNAGATAAGNVLAAGNQYIPGITAAVGQYIPGITGAANAGAGGILSAANGGANDLGTLSANLNQYLTPLSYNAGGLTASFGPNGYSIGSDPARQALINQLSGAYDAQAGAFGDLRSQWTPGESALRAALLQNIENSRTANISDLRANLQKRAVLGSSFAQDAQTRANLDFNQQKDSVISQTYLQELDAQNQLIQNQYAAATNAASTKINELNLQGNLGMQLTSQASDFMKQAAQLQAQLGADAAQLKLTGATNAAQLGVQGATSAAQLGLQGATNAAQLGIQGATAAGQLRTGAVANAGQIATGAATNAGQLGVTGASNAGQIASTGTTNAANITSQQAITQAQLNAQAQAGAGQLFGTLALAPLTGGTSLLGMGANYLTGNPVIPQAPTTPVLPSTFLGGVTPYNGQSLYY